MRSRLVHAVAAATVLAVLLCCTIHASAGSASVRIAVLVSYNAPPFTETLKGFHQELAGKGITARYATHQLDGNATKAVQAARQVKQEKPDLVFALGSLAAEAVFRECPELPVVAGMVLREETFGGAGNATGVYLEFSPEIQFRWIRSILPDARTVGVLYNPGENGRRIGEAARVAAGLGLILEKREVNDPRDIPTALESLARRVDVLWGVYDSMVLTPQTAKHILLFSFRNRIPIVGPSAYWVKAGALYSLEWNYEDVGRQCGEKAFGLLKGGAAGTIPRDPPRKTLYALNVNTAKQMQIEFPETLLRGAAQLFRAEP